MNTVIGLVGEKGGGKGTFTNLLREIAVNKKINHIRSGDVLLETLKLWAIAANRENFQKLAVAMDQSFGVGTLTNAVHKRIINEPADIVVFDGVRWETDSQMVRRFPKNFIVYITADIHIRYERTKGRKEKTDEGETSFEQFLREEQAQTEAFIPRIAATADIRIENNKSFTELREEISTFYNKYLKTA